MHWETPTQILLSATHPPVSGNNLSGQDSWLLSVLQKIGMFLAKIWIQDPVSVHLRVCLQAVAKGRLLKEAAYD